MVFWKPKLSVFAENNREKLLEYGYDFFPNDFDAFSLIDNTTNSTCQPGGGPQYVNWIEVRAPRNDPIIQRTFYNGWKSTHGLKWQTVDLPNGMNFYVWGPVSIRHNDLYTYSRSEVNENLCRLQAGEQRQYKAYGESAYYPDTHLRTRHNYENLTTDTRKQSHVFLSRVHWVELR